MPFDNYRNQFGLRPVQQPRLAGLGSPGGLQSGGGSFGTYSSNAPSTIAGPMRMNTPVRRSGPDVDTQSEQGAGFLFPLSPSQEAALSQPQQQYQPMPQGYYDAMSRPPVAQPSAPQAPSLFRRPDFEAGPTGNEDRVIGLLRQLGLPL